MTTDEQFVAFYRENLGLITRYLARRVEIEAVEDLAADVFEVAWRKRKQTPVGFELAWLYRIAGHLVANHRRRKAGERVMLLRFEEPQSAPSAESIALVDVELAEALKQLTEQEQSVLALTAFEGLGVAEAAVALGISANAASVRLHRARAKLSAALDYDA